MRCRIYQRNLSIALAAGEPPSPRVRRHLARCDACREHHEKLSAMAQRLRDAAGPAEPLSGELSGRILQAVRAAGAERPKRPARVIPLRVIGALAAAASLVLAIVLVVTTWRPDRPPAVVKRPRPAPTSPRAIPLGPGRLTEAFWSDVERLTAGPVADEMQHLAADTRRIGSAMVACLPVDLIRRGDGRWIDALLPGVSDTKKAPPAPASRPGSVPG